MLPIVLVPDLPVLLAGRGGAFAKRRALLEAAGLTRLSLRDGVPPHEEIAHARILFVAGLSAAESVAVAAEARSRGIPVNVEDVPPLCDFHMPALLRRGGLLLTVSTGGGSPALAALLRRWLDAMFSGDWTTRMERAALLREELRAAGGTPAEVIGALEALADREAWLPRPACAACSDAAAPPWQGGPGDQAGTRGGATRSP
jgi:precorrin-2 dehydrogenase/sirohydrochlorin ferrochelatase